MPNALPKQVEPEGTAEFRLHIGPKPEGATGQVLLTLSGEGAVDPSRLEVSVNSHPTQLDASAEGQPATFRFDGECFLAGYNVIAVRNTGEKALKVESVELTVRH